MSYADLHDFERGPTPRTPRQILATGAAWITEHELERLVIELEQAEARITELHASLERTNESYIAAEQAAEQARKALRRISERDLDVAPDHLRECCRARRAMQAVARAALAGNKT